MQSQAMREQVQMDNYSLIGNRIIIKKKPNQNTTKTKNKLQNSKRPTQAQDSQAGLGRGRGPHGGLNTHMDLAMRPWLHDVQQLLQAKLHPPLEEEHQ